MNLLQIVEWAKDKNRFQTIEDYSEFCEEYLSFIFDGLQAVIVSQNEITIASFNIVQKETIMFHVQSTVSL